MWRFAFVLLGIAVAIYGCDVINPDETIPTTIQLEPFEFVTEPGEGSNQNKITEIWVYANSGFLGAFTPPVNVYYLEEGPTTFTFRPGIRNNGIATDVITYPMFTGYSTQLDAADGAIYSVQPTTAYQEAAEFSLLVDFELGNPFTNNRDTVTASELKRSTTDVFEGSYSGEIVLSDEAYFIEVTHEVAIGDLPTDGKEVYLEIRYKNEVEFGVGLLGTALSGGSYYQFFYLANPTDEWNMLYLQLTDYLVASDLDSYKILFRAIYTGPAGEEQKIFFDNIKVVHL